MSTSHSSRTASVSAGPPGGRLTRWSIGLSAVSGVVLVASSTTVALAYLLGGEDAIEDTWAGASLAAAAVMGLLGSLAAFTAAVVARLGGERRAVLWLPLSLFPVGALLLVLGEVFWWE